MAPFRAQPWSARPRARSLPPRPCDAGCDKADGIPPEPGTVFSSNQNIAMMDTVGETPCAVATIGAVVVCATLRLTAPEVRILVFFQNLARTYGSALLKAQNFGRFVLFRLGIWREEAELMGPEPVEPNSGRRARDP